MLFFVASANSNVYLFARYRRSTHVTPKSYLSFLNGYKTVYAEKKENISYMFVRMNTGLSVNSSLL